MAPWGCCEEVAGQEVGPGLTGVLGALGALGTILCTQGDGEG